MSFLNRRFLGHPVQQIFTLVTDLKFSIVVLEVAE